VASIVAAWPAGNSPTSYRSAASARANLQGLEYPADGGRADPVAEREQLGVLGHQDTPKRISEPHMAITSGFFAEAGSAA
jgi:hypothetical protein